MEDHDKVFDVRQQSRAIHIDQEAHEQDSPVQHGTMPPLADIIRVIEGKEPLDQGAGPEWSRSGPDQPRQ